jgi:hypothetical protein
MVRKRHVRAAGATVRHGETPRTGARSTSSAPSATAQATKCRSCTTSRGRRTPEQDVQAPAGTSAPVLLLSLTAHLSFATAAAIERSLRAASTNSPTEAGSVWRRTLPSPPPRHRRCGPPSAACSGVETPNPTATGSDVAAFGRARRAREPLVVVSTLPRDPGRRHAVDEPRRRRTDRRAARASMSAPRGTRCRVRPRPRATAGGLRRHVRHDHAEPPASRMPAAARGSPNRMSGLRYVMSATGGAPRRPACRGTRPQARSSRRARSPPRACDAGRLGDHRAVGDRVAVGTPSSMTSAPAVAAACSAASEVARSG